MRGIGIAGPIDDRLCCRSGIAMRARCARIDRPRATLILRGARTIPLLRTYLRLRMIMLPAIETAIPIPVSGCQRKPSKAAEMTSATMGTITPM